MHALDLIALKDGHWAAHCEDLTTGSIARSRAEAIAAIQEIIKGAEQPARHPKKTPPNAQLYPLSRPGHHVFETPVPIAADPDQNAD